LDDEVAIASDQLNEWTPTSREHSSQKAENDGFIQKRENGLNGSVHAVVRKIRKEPDRGSTKQDALY
jgi:hypothetical protein